MTTTAPSTATPRTVGSGPLEDATVALVTAGAREFAVSVDPNGAKVVGRIVKGDIWFDGANRTVAAIAAAVRMAFPLTGLAIVAFAVVDLLLPKRLQEAVA